MLAANLRQEVRKVKQSVTAAMSYCGGDHFLLRQSELDPFQSYDFGDLTMAIICFILPLQNGLSCGISEHRISAHYIKHCHMTICTDQNPKDQYRLRFQLVSHSRDISDVRTSEDVEQRRPH